MNKRKNKWVNKRYSDIYVLYKNIVFGKEIMIFNDTFMVWKMKWKKYFNKDIEKMRENVREL